MKYDSLNYLELPAPDLAAAKAFYTEAFGWEFVDYGPEYSSFESEALAGGLTPTRQPAPVGLGALVVFKADDIEASAVRIEAAGGVITTPLFDFPGGRRFHFTDPAGNELAVWAEPLT